MSDFIKPHTYSEDVRVSSSHQTRLQLRLENDEPKCATCKYWAAHPSAVFGTCGLVGTTFHKDPWDPANHNSMPSPLSTTDLSVCSKWEPKD